VIIRPISSGQYLARQEELAPFIERAMAYSWRPADNLRAVEAAICKLDAHAVLIEDEDQVIAVAILEMVDTKAGKMWNIWAVAGSRMAEWKDDFLGWMDVVAGAVGGLGIEGLMMGGRPGWARILRKAGYQQTAVIMTKRKKQCH